jgi:hypothetical protein
MKSGAFAASKLPTPHGLNLSPETKLPALRLFEIREWQSCACNNLSGARDLMDRPIDRRFLRKRGS